MKYTVITGASAGIGKALAKTFAAHGHNLIINARREQLLNDLKAEITAAHDVDVIISVADLSDSDAVNHFYNSLTGYDIDVFINNAGFGDFSYIWQANPEKIQQMLRLNIEALTTLSSAYARDYQDKPATLINVSSIVGYNILPPAVSYSATKFYVSAFTEGLAATLKAEGKQLRAKVLAPGATRSDFMTTAEQGGTMSLSAMMGDDAFISAEQLAAYGYSLYQSDATVGYVGAENKLELREPIFPLF